MDERLVADLDRMVRASRCSNRSAFVCDILRQRLVEEGWLRDAGVVSTMTLTYDHHVRKLSETLTGLPHYYGEVILTTFHVDTWARGCVPR